MSPLDTMDVFISGIERRKEERDDRRERLQFQCDIELYHGLLLEGTVTVTVDTDEYGHNLDNFKVEMQDKNLQLKEIDWDDLKERAQKRIKDQIFDYLDEMNLCA